MEVSMANRCSHESSWWKSLSRRLLKQIVATLGPPLIRCTGWVVTTAIPAPVQFLLRLNRAIRTHPWAFGTSCLSLLIMAFAWADGNRDSKPEVLDLGPIEKFDLPADDNSPRQFDGLATGASTSDHRSGGRTDSRRHAARTVSAGAGTEVWTDSEPRTNGTWGRRAGLSDNDDDVMQTGFDRPPVDARSGDAPRVVWLTGEIEEIPWVVTP